MAALSAIREKKTTMFRESRTIGGHEVRPGAVITTPITTDRLLGRMINAGGRCEALEPESWTAVVCADAAVAWEGSSHATFEGANDEARSHARARIDQHFRQIFR